MKYIMGTLVLGYALFGLSANALEVSCDNVAGRCKVSDSMVSCECNNGMGMGSATGYDPDAPAPDPKTEEELLAECEAVLVENCGDTVPDVNEHCNANQLELCQSYLDQAEQFEENCDTGGDVSTSPPSTDAASDPEEPDVPSSGALLPPTFGDNPWLLAECCDELTSDLEEALEKALDCLSPLDAADCSGANKCLEDAGLGSNYTDASKDDQSGASGDANYEADGKDLDDQNSEEAEGDGGSDSCQVSAALGKISVSVIGLLARLF